MSELRAEERRAAVEAASGETQPRRPLEPVEPSALSPPAARLLVGWTGVYLILGQRLYVPRGAGEAVAVGNVVMIALFAALLLASSRLRAEAFERMARMPLLLGLLVCWTSLYALAPVVGYPAHTVFGATVPLVIGAFALTGSFLTDPDALDVPRISRWLGIVVWTHFIAGAMQALWYTRILATPPQRLLIAWDASASAAFGVEQIAGRSVGLFLNPNVFSLLGGLVLVFGLTLPLTLRQRASLVVPASGILLLGASRGVLIAVLLLLGALAIDALRRLGRRLLWVLPLTVAGLLAVHFALSIFAAPVYSRFTSRWSTLGAVVSAGPSADSNTAGRLGAWEAAIDRWTGRPFGSYGPPQMMLGSFTDNDYVTMLLQGGPVLLVVYAGTLMTLIGLRRRSPFPTAVAGSVTLVALSGATQTSSVLLPSLGLFWAMTGTVLRLPEGTEEARRRRQERRFVEERRRSRAVLVLVPLALALTAVLVRVVAGPVKLAPPSVNPRAATSTVVTRPRFAGDGSLRIPAVHVRSGKSLGPYYVDLPDGVPGPTDRMSKTLTSAEKKRLSGRWPSPTIVIDGQPQTLAISVAITGLHDYTRFAATGDKRYAEFAKEAADWLVAQQQADGSWRYPTKFEDLDPQWSSANVQSLAISLLCRVYQDTGDKDYLDCARLAYAFALTPVKEEGTLSTFSDGTPVLEGYAGSLTGEHVLSGAALGLFGVHDLATVTGDQGIRQSFEYLADSLASHLREYDIQGWSRYSLGKSKGPSPDSFHRLHIAEMRAAASITNDRRFRLRAESWTKSLEEWVAKERPAAEVPKSP